MRFFCYNTNRTFKYCSAYGGIPKRLKGRAWKARRHVTVCEGSNPSSSAIIDCRDTYEKVRVFSYFLAFFAIFGLVNTTFINL